MLPEYKTYKASTIWMKVQMMKERGRQTLQDITEGRIATYTAPDDDIWGVVHKSVADLAKLSWFLPSIRVLKWRAAGLQPVNRRKHPEQVAAVCIHRVLYHQQKTWGWVSSRQIIRWLETVEKIKLDHLHKNYDLVVGVGPYSRVLLRRRLATPGLCRHWRKKAQGLYAKGFSAGMEGIDWKTRKVSLAKRSGNETLKRWWQRGWVCAQIYKIMPEIIEKMHGNWDGHVGRLLQLPENKALTQHLALDERLLFLIGGQIRKELPQKYANNFIYQLLQQHPEGLTKEQMVILGNTYEGRVKEAISRLSKAGVVAHSGRFIKDKRKGKPIWVLSSAARTASGSGQAPSPARSAALYMQEPPPPSFASAAADSSLEEQPKTPSAPAPSAPTATPQ